MRARSAFGTAALLSVVTLADCSLHIRGDSTPSENAPAPLTVDAAAIERSGAKTIWEALQRTVHFYIFHSNGRIEHRGRSSMVLPDQPVLELDGVTLVDFTPLFNMSAQDVEEIQVLSGIDGTTFYGTNAGAGVIRIRTKSSPS